MASISTFLRKSPVSALRAYFQSAAFHLPGNIDWEGDAANVVQPLLRAVNEMEEAEKSRFLLDAERVSALADEAGNTALLNVVEDQATFDTLEVGHGCALWVFLNERASFQKAEEVRYTDQRRHGRAWDGFVLAENCAVSTDPVAIAAFTAAIRQRFKTKNVEVDVFERQRQCHDGATKKLIQVAVYREGRPGAALRFSDTGNLTRRVDTPVFEAALTYEPESGAIEVTADRKEVRLDLTKFMARDLLGQPFAEKRLPVKRFYDLDILQRVHSFETDWEDGIEAVKVTYLKLRPVDAKHASIIIDTGTKSHESIWETAAMLFPNDNPFSGNCTAVGAKLSVKFCATKTEPRGKTISLTISTPSSCTLKSVTARERLISAKYLPRWGLLADHSKEAQPHDA